MSNNIVNNGHNVIVRREFNPNTNQLDFFTEVQDCDPLLVEELANIQVNLSRGRVRLYPITRLSDHNGTGANWKDGLEIHTPERMQAYIERTARDIDAAVAQAKAQFVARQAEQLAALYNTEPVVVASVSCAA